MIAITRSACRPDMRRTKSAMTMRAENRICRTLGQCSLIRRWPAKSCQSYQLQTQNLACFVQVANLTTWTISFLGSFGTSMSLFNVWKNVPESDSVLTVIFKQQIDCKLVRNGQPQFYHAACGHKASRTWPCCGRSEFTGKLVHVQSYNLLLSTTCLESINLVRLRNRRHCLYVYLARLTGVRSIMESRSWIEANLTSGKAPSVSLSATARVTSCLWTSLLSLSYCTASDMSHMYSRFFLLAHWCHWHGCACSSRVRVPSEESQSRCHHVTVLLVLWKEACGGFHVQWCIRMSSLSAHSIKTVLRAQTRICVLSRWCSDLPAKLFDCRSCLCRRADESRSLWTFSLQCSCEFPYTEWEMISDAQIYRAVLHSNTKVCR